jgi:hypothetical protein
VAFLKGLLLNLYISDMTELETETYLSRGSFTPIGFSTTALLALVYFLAGYVCAKVSVIQVFRKIAILAIVLLIGCFLLIGSLTDGIQAPSLGHIVYNVVCVFFMYLGGFYWMRKSS